MTKRQEVILTELVKNVPEGIALSQLSKITKVSRRTLYREFNELSLYLQHLGLNLQNEQGRYVLVGENVALKQLQMMLGMQAKLVEPLKPKSRQNALAALLLLADEPQKIISLALELDVSEATIQRDLGGLEEAFASFAIKLQRQKGVGVWLETTELKRRQFLSEIMLNELNDYQFFAYLDDKTTITPDFFLRLLPKKLLQQCYRGLEQKVLPKLKITSDYQVLQLVLLFAICLVRSKKHPVKVELKGQLLRYQALVYAFLSKVDEDLEQNELIYLAYQLKKGDQNAKSFTYTDEYELAVSLKVKALIALVSQEMKFDFSRDLVFFKKLSRHVITLKEIFFEQAISETELQLILLYFASQYVETKRSDKLAVLIVCENGIGTSSLLKQRLKKDLPQVKHFNLARIQELNEIDLAEYDIVLSTLRLPGFPREYQIVSPLLTKEELMRLKTYIKDYQRKYFAKVATRKNKQFNGKLPQTLSFIAATAFFCTELVNELQVKKVDNAGLDLQQTIEKLVGEIGNNIILNEAEVVTALEKRERLAPIGLPDSSLALLHTTSFAIKRCHFAIFELIEPITMQAMDQCLITVKRMLVLLAPENMSQIEQDALGTISSMVIMNDDTLALFEQGDQKALQSELAKRFLKEIKSGIPI
ncbi:BglG family transcription antiterminator [uncultured Ligilactobacillus sp.]|uniref:BglG family transcription antiterminator n=1 Tax=uncultured Ligilactobacillus sp. TaxID=2837633 RepID=UPI00272D29FD|nr:HTH domain-containing protein [uncultured Ligilactobacillus sp.]